MRRAPLLAVLGLACSLGAGGCTGKPPSSVPLGTGPLAQKEHRERAKQASAREQAARRARLKELLAAADADETDDAVEVSIDWDWEGAEDYEATSDAASNEQAPNDKNQKNQAEQDEAEVPEISGDYHGEDDSVFKFEGAPARHDHDDKAKTRVAQGEKNALTITPLDSSNGDTICDLEAELDGTTATVNKDQSCFEQETEETSIYGAVKRGRATFKKNQMTLDLELELTMMVGEEERSGTLKYRFTGERQKGSN